MVSVEASVVAVEREIVGSEIEGLNEPADCCAARSAADADCVFGMELALCEDEKNCAILFVVLDVEEDRLRDEAMIGIAGVVADEEKIFDFRGIVSYWTPRA